MIDEPEIEKLKQTIAAMAENVRTIKEELERRAVDLDVRLRALEIRTSPPSAPFVAPNESYLEVTAS